MAAVVKQLLRGLLVTNEDWFAVFMFTMTGLPLSICLILTLGPAPSTG
jgi:hypothetical protein